MDAPTIRLAPWTADDLRTLERQDSPEMTAYLGGPEGAEKLQRRHEKFLREQDEGVTWPFTIRIEGEPEPAGSLVYWSTEHEGAEVYECGWAIVPGFQGRGLASAGVRLMLAHAATYGDRDLMWAFPRVDNATSSAVCRSSGFRHVGVQDFEYPKGVPIRVDAWVLDLRELR